MYLGRAITNLHAGPLSSPVHSDRREMCWRVRAHAALVVALNVFARKRMRLSAVKSLSRISTEGAHRVAGVCSFSNVVISMRDD